MSVAVFVYDGCKERERQKAKQIKESKKPKEQETNLLVVALARNLHVKDGLGNEDSRYRSELRPGKREREMEGMLEVRGIIVGI